MREILFKAKRIDNGEWVEGYYFHEVIIGWDMDRHIITTGKVKVKGAYAESSELIKYEIDPNTLCQYTGLVDKNGNKIWENDIVGRYSEYQNKYYCGQVKYGEFNCTCCEGVYGWYFDGEDIRDHSCYEVLGNIFDNPELLEK